MTGRGMALVALLSLFPGVRARADGEPVEWQKSFPADRLGSHLSGPPRRIIVIAAGKADASGAASALASALRQSQKATLVMDQAALGEVSDLDDQSIVKAARNLPIDRVLIVRVFAGGAGAADSAVVSIYDKDGRSVLALTTEKGTPLTADVAGGGAGVSSAAAGAVSEVMRTTPAAADQSSDAQREWDRSFIWFENWTTINQYGVVIGHHSFAQRGTQREPLGGVKLYEALNRPDLATRYNHKQIARIAVGTTGGALLLASLGTVAWGLTALSHSTSSPVLSSGGVSYQYAPLSTPGSGSTPWVLTATFATSGLIMAIVAAAIDPNPVSASEARQLVIDYDQALRRRLGLPEFKEVTQQRTPRRITHFALAPTAGPSSAGLATAFQF